VDFLSVAGAASNSAAALAPAQAAETGGLTINFFWVIVSALNFVVFFAIAWTFAFKPLTGMLQARRDRIEQGLKDAEQARRDRERAEQEHAAALAAARREASDILARAQRVAQEIRDADIKATREEIERIRTRAAAEIEAEKLRAIQDLRTEVADLALAAAGKVVGETMTDERERRLVAEFLRESAEPPGSNG
jgi:F-type H+-transporting ATPase subunit b